jgi:DNA modification methylase
VARVVQGDAQGVEYDAVFDGVVTSPPYPGLIDYHEQHRYAYELLRLDDRREREIGAAASGTSLAALEAYRAGVAEVLAHAAAALRPDAPVLVVVNDRRDLYPEILARAGLQLEARLRRHVNRRTGRRAGEYFEDVLVARAA